MNENNNNKDKKADLGAEGSNIWQEILSESISKKDNEEPNIFVFGDKNTGKKSLLRVMNKEFSTFESESKKLPNIEENAAKYGLINYSHLTVKKGLDEDSDAINRVGVWVMNELIDENTFLSLIKPKDMLKSICLIVVDYSRPWTICKSLKKWADFIYEAFGKLLLKFSFDVQNQIRKKSKNYINYYIYFK